MHFKLTIFWGANNIGDYLFLMCCQMQGYFSNILKKLSQECKIINKKNYILQQFNKLMQRIFLIICYINFENYLVSLYDTLAKGFNLISNDFYAFIFLFLSIPLSLVEIKS